MQDMVTLGTKSTAVRLTIAAIALLLIGTAIFGIRWQVGNMLGTLTRMEDPGAAELAALGARWAPADPVAAWLRAQTDPDPAASVGLLENTVRLAPYDHRWRIEFGRALEQDEQIERAEIEFRKAVELAPRYAYPRWQLGNFYLRQDRVEDAMTELKKAAADNYVYREQAFSLAWDYFDRDPQRVEELSSDSANDRAALAYFFAARGRAAESLRNWNKLSEDEKASHFALARSMAHGLYDQRVFRVALEFSRQLGFDMDARPEEITDGSFERALDGDSDSRFGWVVGRRDPRIEVVTDNRVAMNASKSLRVAFRGYSKPALATIVQTVVVEPGGRYRIRFWVRTENLKSAGLPQLEVVNANDDKGIARSAEFAAGSVDWQQITTEFKAPENCTGVTIRTTRAFCGEECPLSGTFWYDDFVLEKLSGAKLSTL